MKRLMVYLGGKFVTLLPCNDECEGCRWKFACFTQRDKPLYVSPTPKELHNLGVIALVEATGARVMQCSNCEEMFVIERKQITHNTKFKCWFCGRFNYGSEGADKFGILLASKEILGW